MTRNRIGTLSKRLNHNWAKQFQSHFELVWTVILTTVEYICKIATNKYLIIILNKILLLLLLLLLENMEFYYSN